MKVFRNLNQIVTLEKALKKDGRSLLPEDLSIIDNASIVFDNDKIIWIGKDSEFPKEYESIISTNLSGHVLTPGIVDCHTHLIFGGDRAEEYSMRLNGADYQEIGKSGGGILATMKGTNDLSRGELFSLAKKRIETIHNYGVTTIEIKSGYGLNFEKEFELSLIINDLKNEFTGKVKIINTYMAAHAIPKEFSSSSSFISSVVIPLLEKLSPLKIIDIVDIFHEEGYFDSADVTSLFTRAIELNIPVKSHADEFKNNDGASLAVQFNALSSDHLLCTSDKGILALAQSKTVATLLPGTGFFLGKPQANARKFLDKGCKVAIGSDFNPGSCHFDNVLQVASFAAPHYKMNIAELWSSITLNSSHSLGLFNQGAVSVGLEPNFSLFKAPTLNHITYHWGKNLSVTY